MVNTLCVVPDVGKGRAHTPLESSANTASDLGRETVHKTPILVFMADDSLLQAEVMAQTAANDLVGVSVLFINL